MNGFLLNMINRHQGMVDKVQPRIRSIFEPEPASAVAMGNAYTSTADTMIKESRDTGFEKQLASSKSPGVKTSTHENPLPVILPHAVQPDESSSVSDLHSNDRNRMDFMNEQIQSVLARLVRKPEAPDTFNDQNGLQKPVSQGTTEQTTIRADANEMGLTQGIEETLRRLKNQTSDRKKDQHGFEDTAPLLPATAVNTEADQMLSVPPQPRKKTDEHAGPLHKSIINQVQTVNTPNSLGGALQTPAWLTAMQTNLNKQLREINIKSQAEPVINVTIGRVEVRAINTEPAKPAVTSNKPTGVLSLDDYLKQRESKGRT